MIYTANVSVRGATEKPASVLDASHKFISQKDVVECHWAEHRCHFTSDSEQFPLRITQMTHTCGDLYQNSSPLAMLSGPARIPAQRPGVASFSVTCAIL